MGDLKMAKRFTDTTKWTNNKWFFNLSIESKLFWMYLLDACDQVGVWEENVELSNRIIGHEYSATTLLKEFGKQIHVFKDKRKWWIVGFCDFQYVELKENSASKPIISHIALLKKHGLWKHYIKCIYTLKVKVKEEDEEEVREEDKGVYRAFTHLSISTSEYLKLVGEGYMKYQIDSTLNDIENYKKNTNYKSLYLTASKWLKKEKEAIKVESKGTNLGDKYVPTELTEKDITYEQYKARK